MAGLRGKEIGSKMAFSLDFFLVEGLLVIVVTLVAMLAALWLVRRAAWSCKDSILLCSTGICYLLDTVWWLKRLHFAYTDILFRFRGRFFKLTVFFMLALFCFLWLIGSRYRRSTPKK